MRLVEDAHDAASRVVRWARTCFGGIGDAAVQAELPETAIQSSNFDLYRVVTCHRRSRGISRCSGVGRRVVGCERCG